jgi:hypothetical protein
VLRTKRLSALSAKIARNLLPRVALSKLQLQGAAGRGESAPGTVHPPLKARGGADGSGPGHAASDDASFGQAGARTGSVGEPHVFGRAAPPAAEFKDARAALTLGRVDHYRHVFVVVAELAACDKGPVESAFQGLGPGGFGAHGFGTALVRDDVATQRLLLALSDLFGQFDKLCARKRVDKLWSLGETYACCVGLERPATREDVRGLLRVAMRFQALVERYHAKHKVSLMLRVGMHGAERAVGAVVDLTAPRYDLMASDVVQAPAPRAPRPRDAPAASRPRLGADAAPR